MLELESSRVRCLADTDVRAFRDRISQGHWPEAVDTYQGTIKSSDTIGDCGLDTIFEDALSGRAEFEGILKLRQPNGSVQDLWNMTISGAQYGDTHAGESFNLIPTGSYIPSRQFALAQGGASASLFSTSITEVDARTCCDTSVLGELGNPNKIEFAYTQGTQNFSHGVGPNTSCMVQFNYCSEVIP